MHACIIYRLTLQLVSASIDSGLLLQIILIHTSKRVLPGHIMQILSGSVPWLGPGVAMPLLRWLLKLLLMGFKTVSIQGLIQKIYN